jgi:hypothetical protein
MTLARHRAAAHQFLVLLIVVPLQMSKQVKTISGQSAPFFQVARDLCRWRLSTFKVGDDNQTVSGAEGLSLAVLTLIL